MDRNRLKRRLREIIRQDVLPAERGLVGAVIFKSKDKTNFRPLTGLMKETIYNDKDVKAGTTYYYQIRSYSSTGTVATSATLETIVKE